MPPPGVLRYTGYIDPKKKAARPGHQQKGVANLTPPHPTYPITPTQTPRHLPHPTPYPRGGRARSPSSLPCGAASKLDERTHMNVSVIGIEKLPENDVRLV